MNLSRGLLRERIRKGPTPKDVGPALIGSRTPKNLSKIGVCKKPYTTLQLSKDFDGTLYVTPCCVSWMEDPDIKHKVTSVKDMMSFWKGRYMEELRRTVSDGSYSMCSAERCPYLVSGVLWDSRNPTVFAKNGVPSFLEYSAEVSCNLSCPSCRPALKFDADTDVKIPLSDIMGIGFSHFLASGAGEFFMSKELLNFARSFRKSEHPTIEGIHLISNGTLFTEREWCLLSEDFRGILKSLVISMDAVSMSIYAKVRKASKYNDLMTNLQFLIEKHRSGEIPQLSISFTVSSDNISDLLNFIRFAHDADVNDVRIDNIQDWGHLGENYLSKAIHLPQHPEHSRYVLTIKEAKELAGTLGVEIIGSVSETL